MDRSYSRSLFPMKDGRLLIMTCGMGYGTSMQQLAAGVIDVGLCLDSDDDNRDNNKDKKSLSGRI